MIHRDDFPMDVSEGIIKKIQELHPGCKVVFAGDVPGEIDPKLQEQMDFLEFATWRSFHEGRCFDCQLKIPINWPPEDENWNPDGWHIYMEGSLPCPTMICADCGRKCDGIQSVSQWEEEGWQDKLLKYREVDAKAAEMEDEGLPG